MQAGRGVEDLDRTHTGEYLEHMTATAEQITTVALTLSGEDRAVLAQILLRSIEGPEEEGVAEAWETEIGRRMDRVRSGTATGRPAEEVFADIRARYQS
jgi:putative addiction module component (TIGR02574 family)